MAPVYAIQVGLPVDQLSWFMAASIFTFILFAWPLGRLCDRLNRGTIMLAINLVIALSAAGVIVGGGYHIGILIGFSALYMGMVASIYPVAVAITNDRMEAHHIVAASTTLLLSYGLGSSLGPLFSSGMMTWLGPQGLYLGCGGVALLLSGYTLWWQWRTPAVPVAEQAAYIATPADTPGVITELDPVTTSLWTCPWKRFFRIWKKKRWPRRRPARWSWS
ncbi:MFS transporter [Oceanimonas sp. NS1]|nr:MFS transporter [Oceanimonas sp. NS1]